MQCAKCGGSLGPSDGFCGKCGNPRDLPARSADSAGPTPFDADAVYLEKTLRHEPMELALDDSVSLLTLGIMLVRAWLIWVVVFIVFAFIGGSQAANGGGPTLLYVGFAISVVVFWVVLLGSKVTQPIGEWRTLLADRAGQSESYYRMITAVLNRRDLPITPRLRASGSPRGEARSSTRSCCQRTSTGPM